MCVCGCLSTCPTDFLSVRPSVCVCLCVCVNYMYTNSGSYYHHLWCPERGIRLNFVVRAITEIWEPQGVGGGGEAGGRSTAQTPSATRSCTLPLAETTVRRREEMKMKPVGYILRTSTDSLQRMALRWTPRRTLGRCCCTKETR